MDPSDRPHRDAPISESPSPLSREAIIDRTAQLFGGAAKLRHPVKTAYDVHELLIHGLPNAAVVCFFENIHTEPGVTHFILGVSPRTIQRRRHHAARPLTMDQSARAWRLGEAIIKATQVLGTQEAAERWLEQPAIGLDRRRPIDLLQTPEGARIVDDYLVRMDYGVYT
jgi:putative toxin-antitoxin system antitoxin component (TIGR02293 family)